MAKEGLERLWSELDGLDREIVQLEARKVEVLRKIRGKTVSVSLRDRQIWLARQRGMKLVELAKLYGLSKGAISKIVNRMEGKT